MLPQERMLASEAEIDAIGHRRQTKLDEVDGIDADLLERVVVVAEAPRLLLLDGGTIEWVLELRKIAKAEV
jgi:hypothetical protein